MSAGPKPLTRQRSPWQEIPAPIIPGSVGLKAWARQVHDELLPTDLTFAMLLPPVDEYVAVMDTCFHLHEIDGDG